VVAYDVTFGVEALFDQNKAHKAGGAVPIRLRLTDANGANVSDAAVVLSAARLTKLDSSVAPVTDVASSSNPDSSFRYDAALGGYIYDYSTRGLTTGTWALTFTATGDPVEHTITFDVR